MLEKIKSSFIDHKKQWLIILAVILIKSVADYHIGVNYYDKDAMICLWVPMEVLIYAFIAIQFIQIKKSNFIWILYFALFYIQETICFALVNYNLPIYFAGVGRQPIDSNLLIGFLLPRTAGFAVIGYIIARVNEVNEQMAEKIKQKKAAKAAEKEALKADEISQKDSN